MLVAELYETTKRTHWNQARYKTSGWAKEVDGYWRRHLEPTFGHLPCNKVTAGRIHRWRDSMMGTPTTANRCIEVLSKVFAFGIEREIIDSDNPCLKVRALPEKKRRRYATEEELARLGRLIDEQVKTHPSQTAFVVLLALTGMRPKALQRVSNGALKRTTAGEGYLVFSGKETEATGEQELVVVPPKAMEVLAQLPVRRDGLLIGPVRYRSFWDCLRRDAGCSDLWLRDLRRTFATVGLSAGVGIDAIGELLNHRDASTTKRYAHLLGTARFESATRIGNRMSDLLAGGAS